MLSGIRGRNCEGTYDGATLQYSLDQGISWQRLGDFNDPFNWFNWANIASQPGGQHHGWTGSNFSGTGSGGWKTARHNLQAVAGLSNVIFRIAFSSDFSIADDGFAFDNFRIVDSPVWQVGLLELVSPKTSCALGANEQIAISITNTGTEEIENLQVGLKTDTSNVSVDTIPLNLPPGDTIEYLYNQTFNFNGFDSVEVCVWINHFKDNIQSNDSITNHSVYKLYSESVFPYFENFDDSVQTWFSGGTNSSWQVGIPLKNVISIAATTPYAWVTGGLDSAHYNNNENSWAQSPCFNFSTLDSPKIRLDIWWNCESDQDGAMLESSIDEGASWQAIGGLGDPRNWYNSDSIAAFPGTSSAGWTGRQIPTENGSNGWQTAHHDLFYLGNQPGVTFRILFRSNATGRDEGFAFDNVFIYEDQFADVAVTKLINPTTGCLGTEFITVEIVNYGDSTLSDIPMVYQHNTGSVITEIYTGSILPDGHDTFTFSTPIDLSSTVINTFNTRTQVQFDALKANDLVETAVLNAYISSFPYIQDFEGFPGGANNEAVPGYPEIELAEGWVNAQDDDQQDWVVWNGPTATSGTGPTNDNTISTALGKYLFVEDSAPFDRQNISLYSPCFNLSSLTAPELSYFSYRHDATGGFNTNLLNVDAEVNGVWFNNISPPIGHQDTTWLQTIVPLTPFIGSAIRFRFRVNNANASDSHDIAIDDLRLGESQTCPGPINISVSNISDTSATISWNFDPFATQYKLQLRPLGNAVWFSWFTANTSFLVDLLQAGTSYEYRVRNICGNTSGSYSMIDTFSTTASGSRKGSLEGIRLKPAMTLFPNPVKGNWVKLKFNFELPDHTLFKIYSSDGAFVRTKSNELEQNEFWLAIPEIPTGLYFIEVTHPEFYFIDRFVIY